MPKDNNLKAKPASKLFKSAVLLFFLVACPYGFAVLIDLVMFGSIYFQPNIFVILFSFFFVIGLGTYFPPDRNQDLIYTFSGFSALIYVFSGLFILSILIFMILQHTVNSAIEIALNKVFPFLLDQGLVPISVITFVFLSIIISYLIYRFRCFDRELYGATEILFGLFSVVETVKSSSAVLSRGYNGPHLNIRALFIQFFGGIYIIVRGLVNIHDHRRSQFALNLNDIIILSASISIKLLRENLRNIFKL